MSEEQPAKTSSQPAPNLLVDLGPLGVFLLTYWLAGVWIATGTFMVATLAALIWSRIKHGKVSILLMFSGVMVLFFGGLTILSVIGMAMLQRRWHVQGDGPDAMPPCAQPGLGCMRFISGP